MKHLNKAVTKPVTKAPEHKNKFLGQMFKATSMGLTENGAVTYTRTESPLLDFFAQAGAMRKNPSAALDLFKAAYSEDNQTAVRILFYLRDVRGGQGERDLFRNCLEWLAERENTTFEKVVGYVPEYGRFDDIFFDHPKCVAILLAQFLVDETAERPSLLAKWLPTINGSSPTTRAKGKFMANAFGMKEKEYRVRVRNLRKKIATVEEQMSAREWNEIDYSHVPSQASRIYKGAFLKHDPERYGEFIKKAETGEVKINAGTLYPYQIIKDCRNNYSPTLEALWNQLPDYTQGKNALVIADTSGSMSGDPMDVSVSLAMYFADKNKGAFNGYFISFSDVPKLHRVLGKNLREKMASVQLGDVANTNLQAVFDLILNTAIFNKVTADELPSTIYIVSDMEFDSACNGHTNYDTMKSKYAAAGYPMPTVVFWNVDARSGKNLPVTADEGNVALVSGYSPSAFKLAVEGKTPMETMLEIVNSERYSPIVL